MLTFLFFINPRVAPLIKSRTSQSWPIKCSHCITIRNSIKLWQSFPFIGLGGFHKSRCHAVQPIWLETLVGELTCFDANNNIVMLLYKHCREGLLLSRIPSDVGSIHHLSRLKFWHLPAILLAALYNREHYKTPPRPPSVYSEDNLLHIEQNLYCKGQSPMWDNLSK